MQNVKNLKVIDNKDAKKMMKYQNHEGLKT